MPLVVLVGIPSSGKTSRANDIKNYICSTHSKTVHLVSENEILSRKGLEKNKVYNDSQKEKEIRGVLMSEALRLLTPSNVVIVDGGNYIKGYRYELYCASKNVKSTQITVECIVNNKLAWEWNESRHPPDRYSEEVFNALIDRYEVPDSRNRWDSPLFHLQPTDALPGDTIYNSLFERKPPPPNQSTQNPPLVTADLVYELDKITQDVVARILQEQSPGVAISIFECEFVAPPMRLTAAQLARYRRQFLNFTKLHPPTQDRSAKSIAQLFVQFLNSSFGNSS